MDANGNMNFSNWRFLEQTDSTLRNHLGLQLMSSVVEKPLLDRVSDDQSSSLIPPYMNGGPYHHHQRQRIGAISEPGGNPFGYFMSLANERSPNDSPSTHPQPNYGISFAPRPIQMPQQLNSPSTNNTIPQVREFGEESGNNLVKKQGGVKFPKSPSKGKKPRTRAPRHQKDKSTPFGKRAPKKTAEVSINGVTMDILGIPIPFCSCTGTPRQCYRWGLGGWQSSCCTTSLSAYPLPSSTKRRGTRIAGRKMSLGAFKKVLERLASEGYDFSDPIDLRTYWAKHGTNKFVTIR